LQSYVPENVIINFLMVNCVEVTVSHGQK